MRGGRRWWPGLAAALFVSASALYASDATDLRRAQQLAWDKQFAAAERAYRAVLERSPHSREAAAGLARVLLWEGRYREARRRFLGLGDLEGAATAAYWQGDFRTAAREFRLLPASATARQGLAAIEQASGGTDRLDVRGLRDDQPFRTWRVAAESTFFSDPLTTWSVTAGSTTLAAPRRQIERTLPFATMTNTTVLPWQRLTLTVRAGLQRYPDDSSRPVGELALRLRTSKSSSLTGTFARHELLTNATALNTHPWVTARTLNWTRIAGRSWMAGIEIGSLRYFDRNRGRYAQAYTLVPVVRGTPEIYLGVSAAERDTAEDRFYLDAVSSARSAAGDFVYAYRGSYTPYWTPKHLREARAIALVTATVHHIALKLQLESGIAHDVMTGFGPSRGVAGLPPAIFSFAFARTSHPARGALTIAMPLRERYQLAWSIERNTTAFYAANAIYASLVRRR